MTPEPIYTAENVKTAWQLIWSLTVFWTRTQHNATWLPDISALLEPDGIRVLNHRFIASNRSQFLVSTTPTVTPQTIPARIKGRLQHALRMTQPRPFQRNYDLTSLGSTRGDKVEAYVQSQVQHHLQEADDLRREFADLQVIDPELNLMDHRFNNHARFICNLHLVVVNAMRRQIRERGVLLEVRKMIRRWANVRKHLLSRAALLPDHIHVTLGSALNVSPISIALSLMNNISHVFGMKPVLMSSCFLGTFGPYDLGAVTGDDWCGVR